MTPADAFHLAFDALARKGCRPRLTRAGQARAFCPIHTDTKPSLGVRETSQGTLLTCFGGCEREAVLEALGLTLTDVLPVKRSAIRTRGRGGIEAIYVYRDDLDRPVAEKVRYRGKEFRWRLPTCSPTV